MELGVLATSAHYSPNKGKRKGCVQVEMDSFIGNKSCQMDNEEPWVSHRCHQLRSFRKLRYAFCGLQS